MIELSTSSAEETERAGGALATEARPGDIVLLSGGLGAGKTTFVRGLARALGYEGDVTSPTFTLAHDYPARIPILHADLWRLERVAEIEQLALDEELEQGSLLVVEWGEAAEPLFRATALVVTIELGEDDSCRLLRFDTSSLPWARRRGDLEQALGAALGSAP
ncbi:MAG: tRNA (adenosine(37)-N6)-threonylcarbamoyltransferase complex ATPase subunit type 1 TsaE [Actinomycetota bacterium]|nr:tRNA (adenosine(37)-N6)-threonylcarbamoyltransferase complex ATPase subunit type 1 TsaE [Actinomycetota bacterium]